MSIASTNIRNDYVGNNSTAVYAYNFKIFAASDLRVVTQSLLGVETTLVFPTNYTVSGVGSSNGGTITLTAGNLATGVKLTILRKRPLTQTTDIRNQGDFYPEVHEDAFDNATMVAQQQQEQIDRSVKLPSTISSANFDPTLPVAAYQMGGVSIGTNVNGTGLAVGPSFATINDAANQAAAASASASQASTSASNAATSASAASTSATNASTSATNASNSATAAANSASQAAMVIASQTGNGGKYLKTDGTQTSWSLVDATTGVTGALPIANGGTGQTNRQNALNALSGSQTNGTYLRGDGTNITMSTIQAVDVPTLNQNTSGTASNITGVAAIANGGTGQTTAPNAINALVPSQATNSGKFLQTNGTTVLWAAATFSTLNQGTLSVFTANGTFTTPSDSSTSTVYEYQILGAGGGGGGSNASHALGGGGGGGSMSIGTFTNVAANTAISISIGTGGTAGASTGGTGGAGGTTSIGAPVNASAGGGAGGTGSTGTTSNSVSGGAGGTASGGLLNIGGRNGERGAVYANTVATPVGGQGGDSTYGFGGYGATTGAGAGQGGGYGAGGGGAFATGGAGGAGGGGLVFIRQLKP